MPLAATATGNNSSKQRKGDAMQLVSTMEAWREISAGLQKPVTRQFFTRVLIPLMVQRGDAFPLGVTYAVRQEAVADWRCYMQQREQRVAAGSWAFNRPYSVEELEEVIQENQP